jgi:hypothetical protein
MKYLSLLIPFVTNCSSMKHIDYNDRLYKTAEISFLYGCLDETDNKMSVKYIKCYNKTLKFKQELEKAKQ